MLKKDKQKVFGGEWTEESMRFFLESKSHDGTDVDFINLLKAYQYMTKSLSRSSKRKAITYQPKIWLAKAP